MQNFTIIDNFLPEVEFKALKEFMFSNNMPWFYSPFVAGPDMPNDGFYFTHIFYNEHIPNSPQYGLVLPLINRIEAKALVKMKANLYPNLGQWIENNFHSDQTYPHKGMVFYVNTNNGYTELEDGTKIESVENRVMLFDSFKPHRSTHCTDEKCRITINLNYF